MRPVSRGRSTGKWEVSSPVFSTEIVAFIVRLQLSDVTWQCGMFRTGFLVKHWTNKCWSKNLSRYIYIYSSDRLLLFAISLFTIWGHGKSISGRPADAFQDWDKSIANLSTEASFDVTPNITEVSWSILYFKRGFSRVTFYSPWNSLRHIHAILCKGSCNLVEGIYT